MTTPSGHTSAIRATKVLGTNVYDTQGSKIGEIEDLVLDKMSNNILFAVVSFGGFLGIGEKYHPMPWASLNYDEAQDGYVVSMTKGELEAAPSSSIGELTKADATAWRDKSYTYYKATPYWND